MLWSRPENKKHAGKLLVVGGNAQGFAAAAEGYSYADKAGAGTVRVLLPDSLQKTVSKLFEGANMPRVRPAAALQGPHSASCYRWRTGQMAFCWPVI